MTSTKAENGKSTPSDADRRANRTLYVVFLSLVIDLLGFTLILLLLPSILDYYGTKQDTLYQSIKDSETGFRELVGAPDI